MTFIKEFSYVLRRNEISKSARAVLHLDRKSQHRPIFRPENRAAAISPINSNVTLIHVQLLFPSTFPSIFRYLEFPC